MFTMKAFRFVVQFWFSFLMVIVVVPVFSFIASGTVSFPGIFLDMLIGFIIANAIGLVIPLHPLADRFAKRFDAKSGSFKYILLTTFVYSAIYVLFFAFLYTALAIGFPSNYLIVVINGIPMSFAVSYVISVAINPIAMRLSFWTCSKKL